MEREIELIGKLTLLLGIIGTVVLFLFSTEGALLFFLGSLLMFFHYHGIKGIVSVFSLIEKRKKTVVLSLILFLFTLLILGGIIFYLVRTKSNMIIFFLSGVLTLALSANIVIIIILVKGKDGRKTLDS